MDDTLGYAALVPIEGTNKMVQTHAFQYEGELVLVATWLVRSDGQQTAPELVIPLRLVEHQFSDHPQSLAQILTVALPEALFGESRDHKLDEAFDVFRVRSAFLQEGQAAGSA